MNQQNYGRKIFFIYPNSLIRDEIIIPLIEREYEAYPLSDHKNLKSISRRFKNSIAFINIDEKLTMDQWEKIILPFSEDESELKFGLFSYNNHGGMVNRYSGIIKPSLGFHSMRQRAPELLKNLIACLENNKVKENRQYIRASFSKDYSTFELTHNGILRKGYIKDLSSVGMTIVFRKSFSLEKNFLLKEIKLFIRKSEIPVSGVFMGINRCVDEELVYVIIFDKSVSQAIRSRIRLLINSYNRERIFGS